MTRLAEDVPQRGGTPSPLWLREPELLQSRGELLAHLPRLCDSAQVPFDVGKEYGNANARELFGEDLERDGLASARRAGNAAVSIGEPGEESEICVPRLGDDKWLGHKTKMGADKTRHQWLQRYPTSNLRSTVGGRNCMGEMDGQIGSAIDEQQIRDTDATRVQRNLGDPRSPPRRGGAVVRQQLDSDQLRLPRRHHRQYAPCRRLDDVSPDRQSHLVTHADERGGESSAAENRVGTDVVCGDDAGGISPPETRELDIESHERARVGRGVLLPRRKLVDIEQGIDDLRQAVRRPLRQEEMEPGLALVPCD